MSEFEWEPPGERVASPFGGMSVIEVLYEFDGPRLFTFAARSGIYLAYLCDETPDNMRYIIVPSNDSTVQQLKDGTHTVRDTLVQGCHDMWMADTDDPERFETVYRLNGLDFPADILPREGITLRPGNEQLEPIQKLIVFGNNPEGLRIQMFCPPLECGKTMIETATSDAVEAGWLVWAGNLLVRGTYQNGELRPSPVNMVRLLGNLQAKWPALLFQETVDQNLFAGLAVTDQVSPLSLAKEGRCFWLQAGSYKAVWSHEETLGTLEMCGNWVAERLAAIADQEDVRTVLSLWRERFTRATQECLVLASGASADRIARIWPIPRRAGDSTKELHYCMATRMVGDVLSDDQLKHLLGCIARITPAGERTTKSISIARGQLLGTVREAGDDFREQGIAAARMLRDALSLSYNQAIDPENVLKRWGISPEMYNSDSMVDAVAIWGKQVGPAILLNQSGPRASLPTGRRFTVAHEMAHLLLDETDFRPFGDVLISGSTRRSSRREVERRANAFAAELLLPERAVLERLQDFDRRSPAGWKDRDSDKQHIHNEIAEDFCVSHELAAWQIIHTQFFEEEQTVFLGRSLKSINDPYR